MKKVLLGIFLGIVLSHGLVAQQISQRTQFYVNRFAVNPAVAGSEQEIPILLNVRRQWLGINEAPVTQTFSAHGFTGKSMGLGLIVYNDIAGPSRNTGFTFSAARHFQLQERSNNWFSFGMSLNLYQYTFDAAKLQTDIPDDPAVVNMLNETSRLSPDITAGVYASGDDWFAGASAAFLVQNGSNIFDIDFNPNALRRTYYVMGGYKFRGSTEFALEPSFLVKATEAAPIQADLVVKGYYNQSWVGLAYRTGDAVAGMLGFRFDIIAFAYSYDLIMSEVNEFSTGTHEFTLGFYLYDPESRNGPVKREKKRPKFNYKKNGIKKRKG
ncbi:MAG: type IX secretion system membrane protein PorP/SprF [Bacteroidota bacterium]